MADFNKVNRMVLKVFSQEKLESGNVRMNCAKSGRKKEDGTYEKSLPISVILTEQTKWEHKDHTGSTLDVSGTFSATPWEKGEKSGFNFTIFADVIETHQFENTSAGKPEKKAW